MRSLVPQLALLASLVACSSSGGERTREAVTPPPARYGTEIVLPRVLEGLPIGAPDVHGRPTIVPCGTCHGEDAGALPEDASRLGGPHAGLALRHGELACAACHAPEARDRLRLADGRTIALTRAIELCAQCHGPQKRDYDHGAHGGMRGHWDLSRGPRTRNHCVACHDPHAPQFGTFTPVAGPRDRFVGGHTEERHD